MPQFGMTIPITSTNNSLAGVLGASLYLPNTTTSGTATVLTAPVLSSTPVVMTATTGAVNQSATVTLQPAPVTIASLTVSPTSLVGSNSATGTITLTAAAPTGGLDVDITSNNAAASGPSYVRVAAGTTSATFSLNTRVVTVTSNVTISAIHSATTKTASLAVSAPSGNFVDHFLRNSGLADIPNGMAVTGGSAGSAWVYLNAPAASNAKVTLSSSNTAVASVPSTVTVPKNSTSTLVNITSKIEVHSPALRI